jgi:hypothetical protein
MRLAIIIALVLTNVVHADARAKAALALAAARRPDPYHAAYRKALAENRALVVWVGCADAAAEVATPEFVHVRVARFPGVTSATVIIAQPSNGRLWRTANLAPDAASSARLRSFVPKPVTCGPGGCGP